MGNQIYVLVLQTLLVLIFTDVSEAQEWDMERQEEGITVYNRPVPGSDLDEFRAEAVLQNISVEEVLDVILDIPSYETWLPECSHSRVVKRINDTSVIYYLVTEMQWPIRDRDGVYEQDVMRQEGNLVVRVLIRVLPDYLPATDQYVRIQNGAGFWELKQISGTVVSVAYQFHSDPDEKVPGWIARKYIVDDPFKTLQHLRTLVQ